MYKEVAKWLGDKTSNINVERLSKRDYILGVSRTHRKPMIINWILLTVKFFIQKQKFFHQGELSLIQSLSEMRGKLLTEKLACRIENNNAKFRRWKG